MEKKRRNNRAAGHGFERWVRQWAIGMGWKSCTTSRYSSKEKDDAKVDLCNTDPFNIQCKYTQNLNFAKVLNEMPKDENYNIIFHKKKNDKVYIIMALDDFEDILKSIIREGIIIPKDKQEEFI